MIWDDDPFRGHEFDYDSSSDLFRCCFCRDYETVARHTAVEAGDPAGITACPGLPAWQVDGEKRVFLAARFAEGVNVDDMPWPSPLSILAREVRMTDAATIPRHWYENGVALIETSPSHAAQLETVIRDACLPDGTELVAQVDQLDPAAAAEILTAARAAHEAKYGKR